RHLPPAAGVARGGLAPALARVDVAALAGAPDHADRLPILHRAGGVVALELGEDHIATAVVVGSAQALQPHERRAADGVFQGLVLRHTTWRKCRTLSQRQRRA